MSSSLPLPPPPPVPSTSSGTEKDNNEKSSHRHSGSKRSRSRSRSHNRHRHSSRKKKSHSRSRSPRKSSGRSRSHSRSHSRSRKHHKKHRRSKSRSRSRSHHRKHHRRSRSRSRSRRRHSRSRSHHRRRHRSESHEKKEENQAAAAATPNSNSVMSAPSKPRPVVVLRADQRINNSAPSFSSPSIHPLSRRPPPPPHERPAALLSHVLPASRSRYAYVFLVMKGDSYSLGAIIGAYSLRLTGTKHALVCMVTPDVSEACRKRMLYVFTEVVEVPYLQYTVKPLRTQKQQKMYNSWVDAAFTKWNMLKLIQYEKTLFVDADKICLANMDHLFEMNTPAGTFSSPWSIPFVQRKDDIAARKNGGVSARGKWGGHKGMLNPYSECDHDSRVTSSMIYAALTEQSFVVIGTIVLLSPSLEDYEQYKSMLTTLTPFGFEDCHSMMDEQSLSYYFAIRKNQLIESGQYGQLTQTAAASSSSSSATPASGVSEWSYIHHRYNYVPWHRYWLGEEDVPYCFHFFNVKPWVEDRSKWADLEAWWELVLAMLSDESIPNDARTDLRSVYPAAMLAQPKNEGCCWCKLSEESFILPQDGAWKKHNVFDEKGHLQCPRMREGFERFAKIRVAQGAQVTSSTEAEAAK